MKVDFYLRTPGNHHCVCEVNMDAVPREGEWVTLPGEGAVRAVHQVPLSAGL